MLRRNRVSSDSPDARAPRRGGRLRNAFVDAGWAIREHVFWRLGDALRHGADAAKWPFERLSWGIRRGLFWRLEDRATALGPVTRGATYGLVIVLAAGAGVAGLLLATPDRSPQEEAPLALATPTVAPIPAPEPKPQPEPKPTLQGATPVFKPESEGGKGNAKKNGGADSSSSSSSAAADSGEAKPLPPVLTSSGSKPAAAATSSKARKGGKVAGPEAIDVARRFAAAFTMYETGKDGKKVRKTLAETAAPELRKALLRRPPRLPANVEVPKAKVLNVVPGPAQGGVYSVSVSLLRVGLTSELRLDMEPGKGKHWRVTDILG